ncbi:MAG TPA: hypothetical protein VGF94_03710 [Kofleriaceae bacterium]|jgi:hypothetical protein
MYALPYLLFLRLHRAAIDARRRDRTWRYLAWSAVAGVMAAALVAFTLVMTAALFAIGWWPLALVLVAWFVLPPLQPLVQRRVLVPLGAVRTAYWLGHTATMKDSAALGLVCAAWAHAGRPRPAGEAWIAARRDQRRPLGDAEIAVTALLAAARGDDDTARDLLRSLDRIVEAHAAVREVAGEWLACDAVARGAWDELAADALAARWPATSLVYLLEGIALRRAGAAISRADLIARWLLAPHRRATYALLAAAEPIAPAAPAAAETVESDGDEPVAPRERAAWPRAIATHLELVSSQASARSLAHAVRAWDLALADDAVRTWLARRALELDAPLGAVDRVLREVARAATDELAHVAEVATLAAPASRGPVGDALARRLRHGRLDALEQGFTRWAARRANTEARAPIDEWREWCALRAAYDTAVAAGGLELRRLAFPHAYTTGTQMAVWLWNARKEYALSHAISAWLLAEALAVGDTEAIELCTRNARLAVPTRTGTVKP